jgi:glucokinase
MKPPTTIGFDMGATTTKTGVVSDGKIILRGKVIDTPQDGNISALIDSFIEEIQRLQNIHPEVEAVGFGVPGIINPVEGIVVNLTNIKGWQQVPLRSIIMGETGLGCDLENDAKAMAYAEWKHGAGKGALSLVCVTLGTGVGGALILNGKLYCGVNCVAGEIGQMSIDYEGVEGVYGNNGALEAYVGHHHISALAKKIYQRAGKKLSDEEAHPDHLIKAANAGDELADQVWAEVGLKIGVGLSNVIWLINPDRIVIGGGVANAGERLFEYIRQTIRARCEKTFWEKLQVVPATLHNDAGIIGPATLASESEFRLGVKVGSGQRLKIARKKYVNANS